MERQREFLVVEVGQLACALPADAVDSALAPGAVTPLPFVPPHVEGLVNVNERVLPLIDLGRLPGIEVSAPRRGGGELIVVETARAPCALRVDRIVGRVAVDDADMQTLAEPGGDEPVDDGTALATARFSLEGRSVLVLGLDALGRQVTAREYAEGRRGLLGRLQQDADDDRREILSGLAVRAAGERYLLPLATAAEILELAPATAIPGAPSAVEGIAIVRQEALLVLSLARLLGRTATDEASQVVVIDRGGTRYGLRVGAVDGIVAADADELRRVDDERGEVSGVLVHDGQVMGLLEADRVIPAERHALLQPFVPAQRRESRGQDSIRSAILEIALAGECYGIPLPLVRRIADHAHTERIAAPDSSLVNGAVNIDGQVLPVVDFVSLLQLPATATGNGRHVWIVVGDEEREWAIPAGEARRIVEVPATAIEDVGRARDGLVSGIANIDSQLVPLLSLQQLMEAR